MKVLCAVFATVIALPLFAAPRTFVSPSGLDTNPCSLAAPCRTFQAAVNVTDNAGEVVALGSAGYGAITISQSLTITVPNGIYAGIAVVGTTAAVTVNNTASYVVLRGLTLNGANVADYGIGPSGATMRIENCVISGFSQYGIADLSTMQLFIVDTLVRDNGTGLGVSSGSVTIDHSRFESNLNAGILFNGVSATIRDSLVSENTVGFQVNDGIGPATIVLQNCTATNNTFGLIVNRSTVLLSNCTVTTNGTGITGGQNAVVDSLGNNTINLNHTADLSGVSLTPLPPS
jgi:parallel beta helix pectate lyase-like protein